MLLSLCSVKCFLAQSIPHRPITCIIADEAHEARRVLKFVTFLQDLLELLVQISSFFFWNICRNFVKVLKKTTDPAA